MAEADIFRPKQRVELLDGEVIQMSPMGARHSACVSRLLYLLTSRLGERALVRLQLPIELDEFSEPEPDAAVVRWREDFYSSRHPEPSDVLLLVEAADTSLRHDLGRKAPLYLRGGIPEVWVVDLTDGVVHVFRDGGHTELRAGDTVAPAAFPDLTLEVTAILG